MGRPFTISLFAETCPVDKRPAPFTLASWRQTYVSVADPTEYNAALALCGDWEHWLRLRQSPSLVEHFDKWKLEVEVKLRAAAVSSLISQSRGPTGTAAAKWLAEGGFAERAITRGRKPKETKDEEASVKAAVSKKVQEDAARLGLTVINSGTK